MGFLRGVFWEGGGAGNTKRPVVAFKKSHSAKSANQVVEPEAGRMVNRK